MNTFSTADDYSILDVLANDGTVTSDYEWSLFLDALRDAADLSLHIYPNTLRPLLTQISPARRGAFTRRAKLAGIIREVPGMVEVSDDHGSRNGGRIMPVYALRQSNWLAARAEVAA